MIEKEVDKGPHIDKKLFILINNSFAPTAQNQKGKIETRYPSDGSEESLDNYIDNDKNCLQTPRRKIM